MSKRDYYEVLGVSRDTSEREIKKAYKRLAMKFHPDRNPGDKTAEANFKEIKEAYEILTDADKKAAYDQFGHAGVDPNRGGGGYGGGQGDFGDIFGDVFGDIFGGGRRGGQRQAARGSDLRYNLELSLEEAVKGLTKELRIPTLATCDLCEGSGAKKRHLCNHLWHLSWSRPSANAPRFLCGATALSNLSWPRQDHQRSLL